MKTKTDTLKLWERMYNRWDRALKSGKMTEAGQCSSMLLAYENVLEMSRAAIVKKLKIE